MKSSVRTNIEKEPIELTLNLQSRPLRFLYCVSGSDDFDDAVAFYTHVWGGTTNWILPLPDIAAKASLERFARAVDRLDPDYIVVPRREKGDISLAKPVAWLKEQYPARMLSFGRGVARKFGSLEGWVGCHLIGRGMEKLGKIPPVSPIISRLYPQGITTEHSRVILPPSGQYLDNLSLWNQRNEEDSKNAVGSNSLWSFLLRLKMGLPCKEYEEYLDRALNATSVRPPQSYSDFLKIQLVCCERMTPLNLSSSGCSLTGNNLSEESDAVMFNSNCLGFYLCATPKQSLQQKEHREQWMQSQLDVICTYWNAHGAAGMAVITPKNEFLNSIDLSLQMALQALPNLQGIYVVCEASHKTIEKRQRIIEERLRQISGRTDVLVVVMSSLLDFPTQALRSTTGRTTTISSLLRRDNSVVFRPSIPTAIENDREDVAFACSIQVKVPNGHRLALPDTPRSSVLLSRSAETLAYGERIDAENDERNKNNHSWRDSHFQGASVRPGWDGVTLIATIEHETLFFIPDEETVVRRHLEDRCAHSVSEVRPNRHTRYMRGIIARMQSAEAAMTLVHTEGLSILQALSLKRASQCGLTVDQILEQIQPKALHALKLQSPLPLNEISSSQATKQESQRKSKLEREKRKSNVQEQIQELLEKDLVKRGLAITCPACDLRDWLALTSVRDEIECSGCGSYFALPFTPQTYYYKANELVVRCLESGGAAVLETASALRRVENAGSFMFGAEIKTPGKTDVEIDLLWLVDETVIIAECKSFYELNSKQIENLRESLPKTLEAATRLNASCIVIGISTASQNWDEAFEVVRKSQTKAQKQGILVHLLVNGYFWKWPGTEPTDAWKNHLDNLCPQRKRIEVKRKDVFGQWPSQFSRARGEMDKDVISAWLNQLRVKPDATT